VSHTLKRMAVLVAAACAVLGAGSGVALAHDSGHHHGSHGSKHVSTQPEQSSPYADHAGDSHHPYGTGSGLSGGPTQAQVLPNGAAPVPLQDPTLGEGTVLPPVYDTLAGGTGG
jgi:hypothetical protein